jgi:hypothetical protein
MCSFLGLGTSAINRKSPAIDRSNRISSFSQVYSLSSILPEMPPFLRKTYKTRKIQKESKMAQINKTKRLTNIN